MYLTLPLNFSRYKQDAAELTRSTGISDIGEVGQMSVHLLFEKTTIHQNVFMC
jgi:hypothetical protein